MKLRRICETLASSEYSVGQVLGVLEDEAHRLRDQERPQHAAQGAEQVLDLELDGAHDDLARLDLGQVEEVVHELGQVLGRLADEPDLLLLLRA